MVDSKATLRIAALVVVAAAGAAALAMTGWLGPSGPGAPGGATDAAPVAATRAPTAGQGGASLAPAPSPVARTPAAEPAPAPGAEVLAAPAAETPAVATGAETPGAGPSDPELPRFDLVRVEPDGAALVAGRAAPGARVEARLDGQSVGETTADAAGQFVLFAELPSGGAARELSLASRLPDRPEARSAENVLILPAASLPTAPLQAAPGAAGPAIATAALAGAAGAPGGASEPASPRETALAGAPTVQAPAGAPSDQALAAAPSPPVLLKTSSTGAVSVLDPEALGPARGVTLDALTYTAAGEVHLSGRGRAGRAARIYADDRRQADAAIDAQGAWRAVLTGLTRPGRYTLRVDEIGPRGQVTSRIETPFLRESPEALAPGAERVVVQPGHSLWAIAHARYGSGTRHALIYGANRDRIRDPDRIYPGQVFDLPSGEAPPPR